MINTKDVIQKLTEYSKDSKSEDNDKASIADDNIEKLLTFVFNILAKTLEIKRDRILKEFINEMIDPDVNTLDDWIDLLDPDNFVKAYMDFKNTAE